jgi:hypothetical protein
MLQIHFLQKITELKVCKLLLRITPKVVYVTLMVSVALSLMQFPERAADSKGLDPAWELFLNHAYENSLSFGTEVIFTYGPLGFLFTPDYTGWEVDNRIFLELVLKGWVALGFILLLVKTNLYLRIPLLAFVFLNPIWILQESSSVLSLGLLCWCVVCVLETGKKEYGYYYLFAFFCGLLSLVKFTLLMSSGFLIFLLTIYLLIKKEKKTAIILNSLLFATFAIGWILLKQSLLNLPAYLLNSWEMASGYGKSMAIYEPSKVFAVGVTALLACSLSGFIILLETFDRRSWQEKAKTFLPVLGIGFLLFLNWKHGFSRADLHVLVFFGFAPIAGIALTVFANKNCSRISSFISLAAVCICCFLGVKWMLPNFFSTRCDTLTNSMKKSFSILSDPSSYKADIENKFEMMTKASQPTLLSSYVDDSTIDVWGNNQGQVIYRGLNYQNRPVFQSYSAYTPRLQKLNASFFEDDSRPEFLLFNLDTIDNHFPPSDDASAFIEVYHRYSPVLQSDDGLLMRSNEETSFKLEKIDEKTIAWGQKYSLKETNQTLILRVHTTTSFAGKVRNLLYKPPPAKIRIFDSKKSNITYNFIPSSWENGVLINPIILSATTTSDAKLKRNWNTVNELSFIINPGHSNYYDENLTVSLYKIVNGAKPEELENQGTIEQ